MKFSIRRARDFFVIIKNISIKLPWKMDGSIISMSRGNQLLAIILPNWLNTEFCELNSKKVVPNQDVIWNKIKRYCGFCCHFLYSIASSRSEDGESQSLSKLLGSKSSTNLFALDFWTESSIFLIYVFLRANIDMKVIRTNVQVYGPFEIRLILHFEATRSDQKQK